MENNNTKITTAERVLWVGIFVVIIIMTGICGRDLLFESYEEGRVEKYPRSNMLVEMKSSELISALSKCKWCEVRTNIRYITIIAKDKDEFNRVVNPNNFAEQSIEMFPEVFELESNRDKSIFRISRNFRFKNGGTTYIPAWLLHSLIDNEILKNK